MNIELNFTEQNNKYVAVAQPGMDFKCQIIFPDGKNGQIFVKRSLNGVNYDIVGTSNISPSPVIQTEGVSAGDFIMLEVNMEPLTYVCNTLE